MTPETLLLTLRQAGVVLGVQDGDLTIDTPEGAMNEQLRRLIRLHKTAVIELVEAHWLPAGQPRPNILDLGNANGAAAVRSALVDVGCDLIERTPSWEELLVVAALLEGES